tara:strand:- start:815 stop:1789 length:975 start_codon:yes stop_codon:yes gene_type:complete
MNVKSILSEQFKDLISEETLNTIEETFNTAVEEKSKQKVELEVENVKTKLDEDYTTKLETVIEHIDSDHSTKLKKLVEAIDTDHAVKLQKLVKKIDTKHVGMLKQVVEKYEGAVKEEAKTFQERIVEEISNYLDLYLEKTVPTQQIAEAVENTRAIKQLDQIRQLVGINEEFVDGEVKEALVDGKKTIDSLRAELNTVIKENVELKHKANKAEAFIVLEQKTADMPSAKKNFINKLLSNKAPEYIKENFSYVVEMFEKDSQEQVDSAKEAIKKEFVSAPKVDRPQIIEEQKNFTNNEIERNSSDEDVSGYLNEMKKISGSRFTR